MLSSRRSSSMLLRPSSDTTSSISLFEQSRIFRQGRHTPLGNSCSMFPDRSSCSRLCSLDSRGTGRSSLFRPMRERLGRPKDAFKLNNLRECFTFHIKQSITQHKVQKLELTALTYLRVFIWVSLLVFGTLFSSSMFSVIFSMAADSKNVSIVVFRPYKGVLGD